MDNTQAQADGSRKRSAQAAGLPANEAETCESAVGRVPTRDSSRVAAGASADDGLEPTAMHDLGEPKVICTVLCGPVGLAVAVDDSDSIAGDLALARSAAACGSAFAGADTGRLSAGAGTGSERTASSSGEAGAARTPLDRPDRPLTASKTKKAAEEVLIRDMYEVPTPHCQTTSLITS